MILHGPNVASFEKVTKENYLNIVRNYEHEYLQNLAQGWGNISLEFTNYDDLKLPQRATLGSAGYDIYMTTSITLKPTQSVIVPTFMRTRIDQGWFLGVFPRSGLGFKYQMMLANTVGIVDEDYYSTKSEGNDNEGHIMIKIVNMGNKVVELGRNERFCQGIFIQYGTTYGDKPIQNERTGGIGSTGT